MELVTNIESMRRLNADWRAAGLQVGLVPTMGFLHEGHLSLIRRAAAENDRVVVSIFVNPIQFGPTEDLAAYPRDMDRDRDLCAQAGVAAIFNPSAAEMYPADFRSRVAMDELTETLCGASRPGHFQGVLTVVTKLFNIVQPHRAYFGRKDAQQLAVVTRLARDLNLPLTIVPCPLVREPDGLAVSSRNVYLNPDERRAALCLSRAIEAGRRRLEAGETRAAAAEALMLAVIAGEPLAKVDYVHIVDAETLRPVAVIERPVLAALAVFIGRTRLIDNFTHEGSAERPLLSDN